MNGEWKTNTYAHSSIIFNFNAVAWTVLVHIIQLVFSLCSQRIQVKFQIQHIFTQAHPPRKHAFNANEMTARIHVKRVFQAKAQTQQFPSNTTHIHERHAWKCTQHIVCDMGAQYIYTRYRIIQHKTWNNFNTSRRIFNQANEMKWNIMLYIAATCDRMKKM